MSQTAESKKLSHTGSWVSLLLAGPVGLISIGVVFFGAIIITELITDETLTAIVIFAIYGKPSLALAIAFLSTLWFTGQYAERSLVQQKSLLKNSFKYSFLTNLVIWLVFAVVFVLSPLFFALNLAVPLLLFTIGTVVSTFTIGLWICYVIRRRLAKKLQAQSDTSG